MNAQVFSLFRTLIYNRSGIALGDNKVALLTARIGKRMRALSLDSPMAYYRRIVADPSGVELTHLLDAISTNVTGFFREPEHFKLLGELFSQWQQRDQTRFRLWSAACSTGEEPYSMAMVLCERRTRPNLNVRILATDINTQVLEVSRRGVYRAKEVEALSDGRRQRFFRKHGSRDPNSYRVAAELHDMILFKQLNLTRQPFPMRGPLDAIFCRNVMIYFDDTVRRSLMAEMRRLLKPGGYLFVGHAESMAGRGGEGLTPVQPAVYRKT